MIWIELLLTDIVLCLSGFGVNWQMKKLDYQLLRIEQAANIMACRQLTEV